jgi:hypothetical protein
LLCGCLVGICRLFDMQDVLPGERVGVVVDSPSGHKSYSFDLQLFVGWICRFWHLRRSGTWGFKSVGISPGLSSACLHLSHSATTCGGSPGFSGSVVSDMEPAQIRG